MEMMTYSARGLAMTESFEGLRTEAYKDGAGIWTIGYGHTLGVHEGQTCTPEQAAEWLAEDAARAVKAVNDYVSVELNQNQFDALVDFTFNLCAGALRGSTLLKLLNLGYYNQIPEQLAKWIYAGGEIEQGLVNRRAAEARLFEEGI